MTPPDPSAQVKAEPRPGLPPIAIFGLATLLVLLAIGAEAAAALFGMRLTSVDGPSAGFLLAAHVTASVLAAEAMYLRFPGRRVDAGGFYWLGLLLTLLLPVFGVVGVASLVIRPPSRIVSRRQSESPEEARAMAMEKVADARRSEQQFGADIESVVDALSDPDPALRLGAMDALRAMQGPEAVRLLQRSLNNTLFDVRFRAVEALGEISQRYSDRISGASAMLERDPHNVEKLLALADLYVEYRGLGVEDEAMQQVMLAMSEKHYRRAVDLGCHERPVLLKLSKCLVELDQIDDAEHVLTQHRPDLADDPDILVSLAAIHFRRGRVRSLRALCRRALRAGSGALPEETARVLRFWVEEVERAA